MSRFFEKYLKKQNVDDVDCARKDINKKSVDLYKKVQNANLYTRVQSTMSTKIDRKHRFPACMRCLNYSWKAEGNLMRPWCKKIDAPVFELKSCPEGRWKKHKTRTIDPKNGEELLR